MSKRPHVLLITTDHWPGSLLGAAGHPVIQTPTLDQLARNGTRFPRAYSECPVCIPARRTLLTGTPPRTHGDRTFQTHLRMPDIPTVAHAFRDAGYQAYAAGKLHVYPSRDRVGFNDVMLAEEGRPQFGGLDDYEIFLGEQGFAGRQFDHGMSNNEYWNRPWHLPEPCHVTNWITQQAARLIKRRNPTRPGFWYVSYTHPHPPLAPLACYLDMYRDLDPGAPEWGNWATEDPEPPFALQAVRAKWGAMNEHQIQQARRAFYALCTHIDHQIRIVIGTLREEGLLDDTVILFTADHGDMLGTHGLWAKRLFLEDSACVPMILTGTRDDSRFQPGRVDRRLVGLQDVAPTLLDLAGVPIPDSMQGGSMLSEQPRSQLYGEYGENAEATRMMHDGRHKLIYYPTGNRMQLFDLENDPREMNDLSESPDHAEIKSRLTGMLVEELYGWDEPCVQDGELIGLPSQSHEPQANRDLLLQRGRHWPPPPIPPVVGN
ncbi:MAG: sulfatase-like hydrolase/transferase [Planctomycetales bacterium]